MNQMAIKNIVIWGTEFNCFGFSELVEAMQDKDAGIALETHEVQDNKVYRHCFSGMYIVQQKLNDIPSSDMFCSLE